MIGIYGEGSDEFKLIQKEFYQTMDKKFPSLKLPSFILDTELNDESPIKGDNVSLKYGEHFLYQIISNHYTEDRKDIIMSYPNIGTFANYNIADQALEYEFITPMRTWENRFKPTNGRWFPTTRLCSHIEWDKSIYIFGIWKSFPDWKELKKAYKKTFYFRENRKDKINRILNN